MNFLSLVKEARTCRRFDQSKPLDAQTVIQLIDAARVTSSAANKVPLRYAVSTNPNCNDDIFNKLAWAAKLTDWHGPDEGEKPTAYIVICTDKNVDENPKIDLGIAAQTIQLYAQTMGIGCCMFLSFPPKRLHAALDLSENILPLLVIALGYQKEIRAIEEINIGGDTTYFRDENGVHHVPKIKLNDVIVKEIH